jgi:hypothetical protein
LLAAHTSPVALDWHSVSAGDGVIAAVGGVSSTQSGIYLSRDNGATWTPASVPPGVGYDDVSVSADGKTLVALAGGSMRSPATRWTWTTGKAPADNYTEVLALGDNRILAADQTDSERYFSFNPFNFGWKLRQLRRLARCVCSTRRATGLRSTANPTPTGRR